MTIEAWKFMGDNLPLILIIGTPCLLLLLWAAYCFLQLMLAALDPAEVKLARIEANRQIQIARAENPVIEEDEDEC